MLWRSTSEIALAGPLMRISFGDKLRVERVEDLTSGSRPRQTPPRVIASIVCRIVCSAAAYEGLAIGDESGTAASVAGRRVSRASLLQIPLRVRGVAATGNQVLRNASAMPVTRYGNRTSARGVISRWPHAASMTVQGLEVTPPIPRSGPRSIPMRPPEVGHS